MQEINKKKLKNTTEEKTQKKKLFKGSKMRLITNAIKMSTTGNNVIKKGNKITRMRCFKIYCSKNNKKLN